MPRLVVLSRGGRLILPLHGDIWQSVEPFLTVVTEGVCQWSPRPPPILMICRRTHRTQCVVILVALVYYSKGM